MTTINIISPKYNQDNSELSIKLEESSGASAILKIDFNELSQFAKLASKEVFDFFIITSCVYGIDRFIKRRANSVDGWSRKIKVTFPVNDKIKWESVKLELEALLSFLTGDYWSVNFYNSDFILSEKPIDKKYSTKFSQVNLFSGGLDSLIGAIDFLSENPNKSLLLISQYDKQMHGPLSDQNDLIKQLSIDYTNFIHVPSVRVFLDNSTLIKETTFRSRSILFIGIALLVAQPNNSPIMVPENGSVSLNFPLSSSRRSACSTRTTHPTFISHILVLFKKIGINIEISNPYEFKTKGEMVKNCKNKALLKSLVKFSNSCGKRGHRVHWDFGGTHCGVCMPCIYRRASLISINDDTNYGNDINRLNFLTKKGQDVGACLEFLKRKMTPTEIKHELIINGLNDLPRMNKYVELVENTIQELKEFFNKYGSKAIKDKAGL